MTPDFDAAASYKELWGSKKLPSYDHWFAGLGSAEADNQFKKHILLLRDYNTLARTGPSCPCPPCHETIPTSDTSTPKLRCPWKTAWPPLPPPAGFFMIAGTPMGLNEHAYRNQICKFDRLNSPKMVVYFEDLISNNHTFIEVADFLNIKYDLKKIDFKNLRDYVRTMYLSSGHTSSKKHEYSLAEDKARSEYFRNAAACTHTLPPKAFPFEKYLARYAV